MSRIEPRTFRGTRDFLPSELIPRRKIVRVIEEAYRRYGFQPLETPVLEYLDALGKFLPDVDAPGEGVFALRDDDEQWLALRYDLTAPLARFDGRPSADSSCARPTNTSSGSRTTRMRASRTTAAFYCRTPSATRTARLH